MIRIEGIEYTPDEAKAMGYRQIRPNVWAKKVEREVVPGEVTRRVYRFNPIVIDGVKYNSEEELIAAGFEKVEESADGRIKWRKASQIMIDGVPKSEAELLALGYTKVNGQWRLQTSNQVISTNEDDLYVASMRAQGYEYLFGEWKRIEDWNTRGYWFSESSGSWIVRFMDTQETDIAEQVALYNKKMIDPCNSRVTREMMEAAGFVEAYGQWRLEDDWDLYGWNVETNTIDESIVSTSGADDLWSVIPEVKSLETLLISGESQYVDGRYYTVDQLGRMDYDYFCGEWRPMIDWNSRGYYKAQDKQDATRLWWVLHLDGSWNLVRKQGFEECDVEMNGKVFRRSELEKQGYHELFGEWKTSSQWSELGWVKKSMKTGNGLWENVDGPYGDFPGCLMSYYYIMFHGTPIRPDLHMKVIHDGKTISIDELY